MKLSFLLPISLLTVCSFAFAQNNSTPPPPPDQPQQTANPNSGWKRVGDSQAPDPGYQNDQSGDLNQAPNQPPPPPNYQQPAYQQQQGPYNQTKQTDEQAWKTATSVATPGASSASHTSRS